MQKEDLDVVPQEQGVLDYLASVFSSAPYIVKLSESTLTMPDDAAVPLPEGLPIAIAVSPTLTELESATSTALAYEPRKSSLSST